MGKIKDILALIGVITLVVVVWGIANKRVPIHHPTKGDIVQVLSVDQVTTVKSPSRDIQIALNPIIIKKHFDSAISIDEKLLGKLTVDGEDYEIETILSLNDSIDDIRPFLLFGVSVTSIGVTDIGLVLQLPFFPYVNAMMGIDTMNVGFVLMQQRISMIRFGISWEYITLEPTAFIGMQFRI